ncbi:hypothetical protein QTN25_006679 [Entamoeba marina]
MSLTDAEKTKLNELFEGGETEAEKVWDYCNKFGEFDPENHAEGCSLDELNIHRILEFYSMHKTIQEFRESLRSQQFEFKKLFALCVFLAWNYKMPLKKLINAPQGAQSAEMQKAQEMVDKVSALLSEAVKKADEATKRDKELEAALKELKKQEDDFNNTTETLKKTVEKETAQNELAQHLASDPLPLRKAKTTTEAAKRKSEKARAEADAAADEMKEKMREAEEYLNQQKAAASAGQGVMWWMSRELEEKKKYMPKRKEDSIPSNFTKKVNSSEELVFDYEQVVLTNRCFKRRKDGEITSTQPLPQQKTIKKSKKKIKKTIVVTHSNTNHVSTINDVLIKQQPTSFDNISIQSPKNNMNELGEYMVFTKRVFKRKINDGDVSNATQIDLHSNRKIKKKIRKTIQKPTQVTNKQPLTEVQVKTEQQPFIENSFIAKCGEHNHPNKFVKKSKILSQKCPAFIEVQLSSLNVNQNQTPVKDNSQLIAFGEVLVHCKRSFKRITSSPPLKQKSYVANDYKQQQTSYNDFLKPGKVRYMNVDSSLYMKDEVPITLFRCFRKSSQNPETQLYYSYATLSNVENEPRTKKKIKKTIIRNTSPDHFNDSITPQHTTTKKKVIKKTLIITSSNKTSLDKNNFDSSKTNLDEPVPESNQQTTPTKGKKKIKKTIFPSTISIKEDLEKLTPQINQQQCIQPTTPTKGKKKIKKTLFPPTSTKPSLIQNGFDVTQKDDLEESFLDDNQQQCIQQKTPIKGKKKIKKTLFPSTTSNTTQNGAKITNIKPFESDLILKENKTNIFNVNHESSLLQPLQSLKPIPNPDKKVKQRISKLHRFGSYKHCSEDFDDTDFMGNNLISRPSSATSTPRKRKPQIEVERFELDFDLYDSTGWESEEEDIFSSQNPISK